jgi:hypothetical protein
MSISAWRLIELLSPQDVTYGLLQLEIPYQPLKDSVLWETDLG